MKTDTQPKTTSRQPREINTVDLFCGAGGATTGLELALSRLGYKHRGLAINHWKIAVDTMTANHPDVDTKQMSIEEAVPADLVPGGRVDFLWASPSCTHHSRAKGGKPRSNQLRAQPELILTWLDQLFVRRLIVENVPEFVEWGPLSADGRPIQSKKGDCFKAWINSIEKRNYIVDYRILNCADFGDPTTRKRFFLQAVRRGCGKIVWPEPEYAEDPQPSLFGPPLKKWRGIRECLDLSDTGKSIFNRDRPLAENTLRRVFVGLRKYCGLDFQMDFLVRFNRHGDAESIDKPISVVAAGGQHHALASAFIVRNNRGCFAEDADKPLSSQQAHTVHHAVCQPIVIDHFKNGEAKPAENPVGAQTSHDRYSVVRAFVMNNNTNNAPRPLDKPMHAITTGNQKFLVQSLVLGQQSGAECIPADKPSPTISTKGAIRLVEPVPVAVVDMSRPSGPASGHLNSSDEPIRTITSFDNLQGVFLMTEAGDIIDVRMRMLKPSELAAAHSFPADYKLTGNRTDQVKQIGNSVPVRTAAALCQAALCA